MFAVEGVSCSQLWRRVCCLWLIRRFPCFGWIGTGSAHHSRRRGRLVGRLGLCAGALMRAGGALADGARVGENVNLIWPRCACLVWPHLACVW